jgi:hypothetical protein
MIMLIGKVSKKFQSLPSMAPTLLVAVMLAMVSMLSSAHGADFTVISVVRSLPMKSGDPVIKDYYINAGSNNGLKEGAFIEALRRIPVYDNIASKVLQDTQIPVARMKIIYVDKNISVARVVKINEAKDQPQTMWSDIIIGDSIRVAQKQ